MPRKNTKKAALPSHEMRKSINIRILSYLMRYVPFAPTSPRSGNPIIREIIHDNGKVVRIAAKTKRTIKVDALNEKDILATPSVSDFQLMMAIIHVCRDQIHEKFDKRQPAMEISFSLYAILDFLGRSKGGWDYARLREQMEYVQNLEISFKFGTQDQFSTWDPEKGKLFTGEEVYLRPFFKVERCSDLENGDFYKIAVARDFLEIMADENLSMYMDLTRLIALNSPLAKMFWMVIAGNRQRSGFWLSHLMEVMGLDKKSYRASRAKERLEEAAHEIAEATGYKISAEDAENKGQKDTFFRVVRSEQIMK